MNTPTTFQKDIRAALVARLKELGTSLTKVAPAVLGEEMTKLMNDEAWQAQFTTEAEFETAFKTAFKEILVVAKDAKAEPEQIAAIEQLVEPAPVIEEVVMQVAADEPVAGEEVVMKVVPAEEAAEQPAAEPAEELTHKHYCVEFHPTELVAVPFNDVEMARAYSRRRTTKDQILNQVVNREQYSQRYEKGSLLEKMNLLDKPYRIGEATSLQQAEKMKKQQAAAPAPAPAPAATKEKAPAAPKKAAEAKPAPAAAGEVKKGQPVPLKRLPIPGEGAAPAEVFQARLSHLETLEQYEAIILEMAAAGLQLQKKANHVPLEYAFHEDSEDYAGGVCMRFRRAGEKTDKVEAKAYLHTVYRYMEVAPVK